MLITCDKMDWGPKPFRALDVWFSNPQFTKVVQNEWKNLVNLPLQEKLKKLKAGGRN